MLLTDENAGKIKKSLKKFIAYSTQSPIGFLPKNNQIQIAYSAVKKEHEKKGIKNFDEVLDREISSYLGSELKETRILNEIYDTSRVYTRSSLLVTLTSAPFKIPGLIGLMYVPYVNIGAVIGIVWESYLLTDLFVRGTLVLFNKEPIMGSIGVEYGVRFLNLIKTPLKEMGSKTDSESTLNIISHGGF